MVTSSQIDTQPRREERLVGHRCILFLHLNVLVPVPLGVLIFFFSKKILIPLAGLGIDPVVLLREDRLPTHGCGFPALPRILRCHTHENKSSIKPTIARSDLENYTGRVIDNLQ